MLKRIKSFGKLLSLCLEIKSSAKVKSTYKANSLVTGDKVLAKTFNKFFDNVAATLGIKYEKLPSNYDSNYNLDELIIRHNNHASILTIKNKYAELNPTFTFRRLIRGKYP